jgi:hypothetical protein
MDVECSGHYLFSSSKILISSLGCDHDIVDESNKGVKHVYSNWKEQ